MNLFSKYVSEPMILVTFNYKNLTIAGSASLFLLISPIMIKLKSIRKARPF